MLFRSATGRTWWADALVDQHRAGIAMLAVMVPAALVVIGQGLSAARRDRHPDRRPARTA